MASHHQVATHHQGPMACLTGQIPKSKISLSSFHLISGAMLAFPPGKLPFAIWQTYPDPPQNPDHTLTAHIWIWGSPLHSSDQVFGYHNAWETEKSQNQFSKTLQKKSKSENQRSEKNLRCTDGLTSSGGHTSPGSHGMSDRANPQIQNFP